MVGEEIHPSPVGPGMFLIINGSKTAMTLLVLSRKMLSMRQCQEHTHTLCILDRQKQGLRGQDPYASHSFPNTRVSTQTYAMITDQPRSRSILRGGRGSTKELPQRRLRVQRRLQCMHMQARILRERVRQMLAVPPWLQVP